VYFEVAPERYLVDLPGYGYAKVPMDLRAHWQEFINKYFQTREALKGLVVVMDVRHPLREFDQAMLEYAKARALPGALPADQGRQAQSRRRQLHAAGGAGASWTASPARTVLQRGTSWGIARQRAVVTPPGCAADFRPCAARASPQIIGSHRGTRSRDRQRQGRAHQGRRAAGRLPRQGSRPRADWKIGTEHEEVLGFRLDDLVRPPTRASTAIER
jgi:hypothetical protein